jgi:hydroxyethylthiazole kinase-like uncharacterized protein yjeF
LKAATAAEMRQIDQTTIQNYGIPGLVLMENAGLEVVHRIVQIVGDVKDKKVCIFSGKGNNGGDGYVVARHLVNKGAKVKVFLFAAKEEIAGDAAVNLDIVGRMEIDVLEVSGTRDWDKIKIAVAFADCIVDALLGTGFQGDIHGLMAQAIQIINGSAKPVVAVDIPSGVDANTGQIRGQAVKAQHTVTFGLPKTGLLLYPGAAHVGVLTVADIGLPCRLLTDDSIKQNMTTAGYIKDLLGVRPPDAHKGSNGRVAVVAGSRGMTGAAALASTAALRAGAGLVTLAVADSLHDIMEIKLTEVMTKGVPETAGGAVGRRALPYIMELAGKSDVLAVGPGLGRHDETMKVVLDIIKTAECPLVIDADGLNALVDNTGLLAECKALPVLTPHPGEMGRLTGLSPQQVNQDRISVARQAAATWGAIVILKGARTVIAFPDGEVYINPTGNPGMATGGTGDVLTGVVAGLIAQGMSSHQAAVAGVYIHGLAGDIIAESGTVGLMAGDVLQALPAAILGLTKDCI